MGRGRRRRGWGWHPSDAGSATARPVLGDRLGRGTRLRPRPLRCAAAVAGLRRPDAAGRWMRRRLGLGGSLRLPFQAPRMGLLGQGQGKQRLKPPATWPRGAASRADPLRPQTKSLPSPGPLTNPRLRWPTHPCWDQRQPLREAEVSGLAGLSCPPQLSWWDDFAKVDSKQASVVQPAVCPRCALHCPAPLPCPSASPGEAGFE